MHNIQRTMCRDFNSNVVGLCHMMHRTYGHCVLTHDTRRNDCEYTKSKQCSREKDRDSSLLTSSQIELHVAVQHISFHISQFISHINKPLLKLFLSHPDRSPAPSARSIACLHAKHIMHAFALRLAISCNQFDFHLHLLAHTRKSNVLCCLNRSPSIDLRPAHLLSCNRYYCHCNRSLLRSSGVFYCFYVLLIPLICSFCRNVYLVMQLFCSACSVLFPAVLRASLE